MDWTQPVRLAIPADLPPFKRVVAMLGHYDARLYCAPGSYVDVGAGSLPVVERLRNVPGQVGRVGSIGRFCEFNETASVLVHGEHDHDRPVNITFSALKLMGDYEVAKKRFRPFAIGSGVVASAGAIILDGVTVGDGAVIGAQAVVTQDVPERAIVAGVPARILRERKPFAAWWDWQMAYILANKERLDRLALSGSGHPTRPDRPRFCLKLEGGKLSFEGLSDGEGIASLSSAPETVQAYVVQALQSDEPYWLADCWA